MDEINQPWKFSQCFGDKSENVEVADGKSFVFCANFALTSFCLPACLLADIISAVQFDSTGDFLASGDRAGRVVLFQRNYSVPHTGSQHVLTLFLL
jgi:serine/threonine-protein phosphatase 2A regulatory subunit B